MTVINEKTLKQRNRLVLVLITVFVIAVLGVTISIYIINSSKSGEDLLSSKTNILFIVVDDLRPALGCYGDLKAVTPNIDLLASKSIIFKHAYAQQALGGPSRISFLTSRRPDTLHLYDNGSYWRDTVGKFISIPQLFKTSGYETISIGKVFQHGIVSNHTDDYPYSWSEFPYWPPAKQQNMNEECLSSDGTKHVNLMCPVDLSDQQSESLPDIESINYAMEYLRNKSVQDSKSQPFFLGLGFYKPHIPFKFPKEFLDLYLNDAISLATNDSYPVYPNISWNPWMDIRDKEDVQYLNLTFPYENLPTDFQKVVRQSYYSTLSYVDDLLGKLFEVLEQTGFATHTAIVLLSDHGWSLGEHQEWSKYNNFEVTTRVPLILHVPGLTEKIKKRKPFRYIPVLNFKKEEKSKSTGDNFPKYVSKELVELVDIFPTLSDIAGIAIPPLCRIFTSDFCSEGLSFYQVIKHHVFEPWVEFKWKTAAFSQYPRPSFLPRYDSDQPQLKDIIFMGYSIRTEHFRYTEWVKFDNKAFRPNRSAVVSRELYDYRTDPFEIYNIADVEMYANLIMDLSKKIKLGWRHALPPGLFDGP